MKNLVCLLALWSSAASSECVLEASHLVKLDRQVLGAKTTEEMAEPLACILRMHEEGDGFSRYMASSFLKALLGGDQIQGVMKDARYKKVADALKELTLKNNTPLKDSVIAYFARGDWTFYKLFCEEGDVSFCPTFLPDESRVQKESPLLAAASMLRLKKAYQVLDGKEREEVATRIKNLYREIPLAEKLQRKFIDQIYRELFGPGPEQKKS